MVTFYVYSWIKIKNLFFYELNYHLFMIYTSKDENHSLPKI